MDTLTAVPTLYLLMEDGYYGEFYSVVKLADVCVSVTCR